MDSERQHSMNSRTMTINALPAAYVRLGALVALGLAAFFVGWLVMNRGDDSAPTASGATAKSESELRSFAESVSHPVYWAGPKDGNTYEVTRTSDGRVYVRYLPEGTQVGDPRARFLTVGTYPRAGAWAELKRAARARRPCGLQRRTADERVLWLPRCEVSGRGFSSLGQ
jgi:hypothetical protein